jgi:hypothetical protein
MMTISSARLSSGSFPALATMTPFYQGISPIPVRAAATSHQRVEDEDDDEYEDDSRWALMSSSAFLMR